MKNIKTFENFSMNEARYQKSYFKNPAVELNAEEEDLSVIDNEDLTGEGIIAKMKEMQEENKSVAGEEYDKAEKDLKALNMAMPKEIIRCNT